MVPVVARTVGAVGPPIVVRHGADKLGARHKRRARVRRALQYGARHVERRRGRGVVPPVVALLPNGGGCVCYAGGLMEPAPAAAGCRHAVRRRLGAEVVVVRQRAERPVADDARRAYPRASLRFNLGAGWARLTHTTRLALRSGEPQHTQRVLVRRRRVSKAKARLPLGG